MTCSVLKDDVNSWQECCLLYTVGMTCQILSEFLKQRFGTEMVFEFVRRKTGPTHQNTLTQHV